MGRLKDHFFDEIVASEPQDVPVPGPALVTASAVHVLLEHNAVGNTTTPIGVYLSAEGANTDLAIMNAGRYIYACSQALTYSVVEVTCHA